LKFVKKTFLPTSLLGLQASWLACEETLALSFSLVHSFARSFRVVLESVGNFACL